MKAKKEKKISQISKILPYNSDKRKGDKTLPNKHRKNIPVTYMIMESKKERFKYSRRICEKAAVEHIINLFNEYEWILDEPMVGKLRPDMSVRIADKYIFIEIDENQHRSYTNEVLRMNRFVYYLDPCKVIFIRFNPDDYIIQNGHKYEYYPSCWDRDVDYIDLRTTIWNVRMKQLEKTVRMCINNTYDDQCIPPIYLYYDSFLLDDGVKYVRKYNDVRKVIGIDRIYIKNDDGNAINDITQHINTDKYDYLYFKKLNKEIIIERLVSHGTLYGYNMMIDYANLCIGDRIRYAEIMNKHARICKYSVFVKNININDCKCCIEVDMHNDDPYTLCISNAIIFN